MLMPSIFGENLFNDDWMDFSFPDVDKALYGKHAKNVMKTDVKETDNSYEVDIDLPGFKKDEIEAKLENGYLTISAAKGLDKEEKEEKDGKYIRKERYSGAMSRSFYVGDELKQEDIKAKYEDGILKLSVPKKEQKKVETTKHIAIENTANYHYCDNGSSLTKKYNPNRFIMEKRLMKKEISELEKIFEKDEFIQRLYKAFLGRVRYCIKQEVLLNSKKIKIRKNIKAICSDETVQDIILNFDDKKIQITKRIVNFFIKKKLVFALMIVFRIKK